MRISDWSSDVCSSDLGLLDLVVATGGNQAEPLHDLHRELETLQRALALQRQRGLDPKFHVRYLQRVAIELERERRLAPIVEQCITPARHRRQRHAPRETAPGRDHPPSVPDLGYISGHKHGNVKDRHPWCQT